MKNLFAFTETNYQPYFYPGYISINKHDDGGFGISARERGDDTGKSARVVVSPETLENLAVAILTFFGNQESAPAATPEPLSNFTEGQWWIKELDAFARSEHASDDQKRAVAVVHHLLKAVAQESGLTQPAESDDVDYEVLSRDIFTELGYVKWDNFLGLIERAKNMIENGVAVGRITGRARIVPIGSGAFREVEDHALDAKAHLLVKLLASSYKLNGHHIARNETAILGLVKKWCEHRGLSAVPQGYIDGKYSDLLINSSISIEFDEPHHGGSRQKNKDEEKERIAEKSSIKTLRFSLQSTVVDIICAIEDEMAGRMVGWKEAHQLSELPAVDEALRAFIDSASEDNAVGLVQAVLEAAQKNEG